MSITFFKLAFPIHNCQTSSSGGQNLYNYSTPGLLIKLNVVIKINHRKEKICWDEIHRKQIQHLVSFYSICVGTIPASSELEMSFY